MKGKQLRKAIKESDLIIVLRKGCGKGTISEICYCKRIQKPFKSFKTIEEVINYLEELK